MACNLKRLSPLFFFRRSSSKHRCVFMICASVGVAIWELCRKNGDPRPFRCRAVGEEASLVSIKQQRRPLDPVPMKITVPHHNTRAFLIEKGAARAVSKRGVGKEGGSIHQAGQQLVG